MGKGFFLHTWIALFLSLAGMAPKVLHFADYLLLRECPLFMAGGSGIPKIALTQIVPPSTIVNYIKATIPRQ